MTRTWHFGAFARSIGSMPEVAGADSWVTGRARFRRGALRRVAKQGEPLEQVISDLVKHLEGMFLWGHPRSQINVISHPSIASIIGVMLASTYNPNLVSDESGRSFSAAEVCATSMAAELVGYDAEKSGGVFTFGGTGAMLYGVKVGLEKAVPGALRAGCRSPSSCWRALTATPARQRFGLVGHRAGQRRAGADRERSFCGYCSLGRGLCAEALAAGKRIAAIVATMWVLTDAFGIDDLARIHALRDELVREFSLYYVPHIHADAVIGWAWSVFNDYDFLKNELGFRGRTVLVLASWTIASATSAWPTRLASIFTRPGFYASHFVACDLSRSRCDLRHILRPRESLPYLFQSGMHHPGLFTLETSRSATGPWRASEHAALRTGRVARAPRAYRRNGQGAREMLVAHPDLTVLNEENVGPVTLFRVYPHGVDTFTIKERERSDPRFQEQVAELNAYNRRVFERVQADALSGHGIVISMTDAYSHSDFGVPISALKSYVLSPFTDEVRMHEVIRHVIAARDAVDAAAPLGKDDIKTLSPLGRWKRDVVWRSVIRLQKSS